MHAIKLLYKETREKKQKVFKRKFSQQQKPWASVAELKSLGFNLKVASAGQADIQLFLIPFFWDRVRVFLINN